MMLSITIVALAITLTLLQFLKQSRFGWQVAKWLSLLLFALSAWNVYDQNADREFYIRSLEQIGTRVQWRETEVSVELISDAEPMPTQEVRESREAREVSVQMKVLSPNRLRLPSGSPIDLEAIKRSCVMDRGLGYMPASEAKELFQAFAQPDGSIYFDAEKAAGIEHLVYWGKESITAPLGTRVLMQLALGPNTQSQFSSLSDLNNTFVIALIQPGGMKDAVISGLSMDLVSAAGRHLIRMPVRIIEPGGGRSTAGSRYVGLCIPDGYFGVVRLHS